MCGLCTMLGGGAGAAGTASGLLEADAVSPAGRVRRRAAIALLNEVLRHYALRLDDRGARMLVLRTATGRAVVLAGFADLWPAAERLSGRPCDPLDPRLLAGFARVVDHAADD